MNKEKIKTIVFWLLIIMTILFTLKSANAAITDESNCDDEGFFYRCTGTLTEFSLDGADRGVELNGVTIANSAGQTGVTGDPAVVSISSNWRVRILSSSITATGGAGSTPGSLGAGGTGGLGNVSIVSGFSEVTSTNITAVGGAGGNGNGDGSPCNGRNGGVGGASYVVYAITTNLTTNGSLHTSTSGAGGNAQFDALGAVGGAAITTLNTNKYVFDNVSFVQTSGNGGNGDDCDTSSGAGGNAGSATLTINTKLNAGENMSVTQTGGVGGNGDAVAESCSDGGIGGSVTANINLSNSSSTIVNDIVVNSDGGNGGSVTSSCDDDNNDGGDGGSSTLNVYSDTNINISSGDFDLGAGNGITENRAGHGGSVVLNFLTNGKIQSTDIDLVGAIGGGGSSGFGGDGGSCNVSFKPNRTLTVNQSTISCTGANGGNDGSGFGGFGGAATISVDDGNIFFIGNIDVVTGGDGGSGSSSSNDRDGGKATLSIQTNEAFFRNNRETLIGGDANTASKAKGGRILSNNIYLQIRDSNFTMTQQGTSNNELNLRSSTDIDFQNNTRFTSDKGLTGIVNLTSTDAHLLLWSYTTNFILSIFNANDDNLTLGERGTSTTNTTFNDGFHHENYTQYYTRFNTLTVKPTATVPLVYNDSIVQCQWNITFADDADFYGDTYGLLANVTWYINDTIYTNKSQFNTRLQSGLINVTNSSANLNSSDFDLSQNITCRITTWNETVDTKDSNDTQEVQQKFPYNVTIDVGNDGTIEYVGNGALTTAVNITNGIKSFNKYLQQSCNSSLKHCEVPIATTSLVNGSVNFTFINISYGQGKGGENTNITTEFFSTSSGLLEVSNPVFTYFNLDDNITIRAHTDVFGNEIGTNRTVIARYSRFNITLPQHFTTMYFVPEKRNETNVTPLGQTDSFPFYNITALGEVSNMSVRVRRFTEAHSCLQLYFGNSSANRYVSNVTDTSVWQTVFTNFTNGQNIGSWFVLDLVNCPFASVYTPQLFYQSKCTECVKW